MVVLHRNESTAVNFSRQLRKQILGEERFWTSSEHFAAPIQGKAL